MDAPRDRGLLWPGVAARQAECASHPGAEGAAPYDGPAKSADELPFVHFATVEIPREHDRWIVPGFWPLGGVGVVGGDAKLGKSSVTSDLAVSVASGTPLFDTFEVTAPGPVLVCSMEGQTWLASDRILNLCRHRGLEPEQLPIGILNRGRLRLDDAGDQASLTAAVRRRLPRVLILDPLVRLHDGDENGVGHIARLLGYLQGLQRETGVAILLVHHNRKNVSRAARPGAGLRGTTDLHAWGDTNWYLRHRKPHEVSLTVEHRAAASPETIRLSLVGPEGRTHFEILDDEEEAEGDGASRGDLREKILCVLGASTDGLGFGDLRKEVGIGAPKVSAALKVLSAEGVVSKAGRGWVLRSVPPTDRRGAERNAGDNAGPLSTTDGGKS